MSTDVGVQVPPRAPLYPRFAAFVPQIGVQVPPPSPYRTFFTASLPCSGGRAIPRTRGRDIFTPESVRERLLDARNHDIRAHNRARPAGISPAIAPACNRYPSPASSSRTVPPGLGIHPGAAGDTPKSHAEIRWRGGAPAAPSPTAATTTSGTASPATPLDHHPASQSPPDRYRARAGLTVAATSFIPFCLHVSELPLQPDTTVASPG